MTLQLIRRHLLLTPAQAGHTIGEAVMGRVISEEEWQQYEEGTLTIPMQIAVKLLDLVEYRRTALARILEAHTNLTAMHKLSTSGDDGCPALPVLVYNRLSDFIWKARRWASEELPQRMEHWKPWNSAVCEAAALVHVHPVKFNPNAYGNWLKSRTDTQHMRHCWATFTLHGEEGFDPSLVLGDNVVRLFKNHDS